MTDTFSPQSYESQEELKERSDAALEELKRAGKEYSHWVLQQVYAQVRAEFPTATSLVVDASDLLGQGAWIASVNAGSTELWSFAESAEDPREEINYLFLDASVLLGDALRYQRPHVLPGWSLQRRMSGLYVADLGTLPPALNLSRKNGARAALPAGIPGFLHETMNIWVWGFARAAYEYSRGLVEGRCKPLTSLADWRTVPAALGLPVSDDGHRDFQQLTAEDWEIGITAVHGLAEGVVESEETGEGFGAPSELAAPVQIHEENLSQYGLSLHDVARAFGGNVRSAAVAITRSLDTAERR